MQNSYWLKRTLSRTIVRTSMIVKVIRQEQSDNWESDYVVVCSHTVRVSSYVMRMTDIPLWSTDVRLRVNRHRQTNYKIPNLSYEDIDNSESTDRISKNQSEMSYSRIRTDIRRIENIQLMMISRVWNTQWKDPIQWLISNIKSKSVCSNNWWSGYKWGSRVILSQRGHDQQS